MRTPKETLERLAEVAPKEWGVTVVANGSCVADGWQCYALHGEVFNGQFTAFLKEKLVEMGYLYQISVVRPNECRAVCWTPEVGELIFADNYTSPTEWQAVAEAMIGVLER